MHRFPVCAGALLGVLLAGVACGNTGVAIVRINQGPYQLVPMAVDLNLDGTVSYAGSLADPAGAWEVEISFGVDQTAAENGSIDGLTRFRNLSSRTMSFEFDFDAPLCPGIEIGCLMGASVQMQLQASGDGALINLPPGDDVFQARVDESQAYGLFPGPFFMMASGSGVMSTTANFGTPLPSQPGPQVLGTIGTRHRFDLSSGDTVTFDYSYVVGPSDGEGEACYEESTCDLNHDGVVSFPDLALLLAEWGPCDGCAGDLNSSGGVDVLDLLVMLSYWGG